MNTSTLCIGFDLYALVIYLLENMMKLRLAELAG